MKRLCARCGRYAWYEECSELRCDQPMKPRTHFIEIALFAALLGLVAVAISTLFERLSP